MFVPSPSLNLLFCSLNWWWFTHGRGTCLHLPESLPPAYWLPIFLHLVTFVLAVLALRGRGSHEVSLCSWCSVFLQIFVLFFDCPNCNRYFSPNLWPVKQTYANNGAFCPAARLDIMSILYIALAKMQTISTYSTKRASWESLPSRPEAGLRPYHPVVTFREAERNWDWVSTVFQYMDWNGLQELKSL